MEGRGVVSHSINGAQINIPNHFLMAYKYKKKLIVAVLVYRKTHTHHNSPGSRPWPQASAVPGCYAA